MRAVIAMAIAAMLTSPSTAAVVTTETTVQETPQAVDARFELVFESFVRLLRIMSGVVDASVAGAESPEALVAALHAKRDQIDASRREVRQIGVDLAALDPVRGEIGTSSPVANSLTEQAVAYVAEIDSILGRLGELADARPNDARAIDQGIRAYQEASVSLVQANATTTRLHLRALPPGQSQGFQAVAGAGSADATATILRRIYDMIDDRTAAARLRASEAEIRDAVARGRVALEAEVANSGADTGRRDLIQAVVPLQRETFDVLTEFASLAGAAAEAAEAADGPAFERHYVAANQLQQRLSDISIRQSALISDMRR